jgi:hypothetical protein
MVISVSHDLTRGNAAPMPHELTPQHGKIPGPDDAAHDDGLLMHELTVVNSQLGRYVLRYLDADAGHAEPISPAHERALADRLARAADAIRNRATRREQDQQP